MISHETLEKFLSLAPRWKVISMLVLVLLVLVCILAVYKFGESRGKSLVNQRITRELEASVIREKAIRAEAEKLTGVNDLLKAQNQAQADLLIEAEDKNKKESAEKLKQIFDAHQQKIEEINSETDVKNSIRSLCNEAAAAGYKLSNKFCLQAN